MKAVDRTNNECSQCFGTEHSVFPLIYRCGAVPEFNRTSSALTNVSAKDQYYKGIIKHNLIPVK